LCQALEALQSRRLQKPVWWSTAQHLLHTAHQAAAARAAASAGTALDTRALPWALTAMRHGLAPPPGACRARARGTVLALDLSERRALFAVVFRAAIAVFLTFSFLVLEAKGGVSGLRPTSSRHSGWPGECGVRPFAQVDGCYARSWVTLARLRPLSLRLHPPACPVGFGILGIPLPVLLSKMVVSRCRGIGPPSGIPSSGLCFCWPTDYVVVQRPPARFPVSSVCVGVACPARGFCYSPRCFPCVFL